MPTRKKASQSARARKGAPPAARAETKPASRPKAQGSARCAALTQKGTRCRLKPQDGSEFCARHVDAAALAEPVSPAAAIAPTSKNGQARRNAKTLPWVKPEPVAADSSAENPLQDSLPETPERTPEETQDEAARTDPGPEVPDDDSTVLYGSEWSSTMEASPYDDATTRAIASGEDDVELLDEQEMGGARQESAPLMERSAAEAKAGEILGARPDIAPEEDLEGELASYDQRFEAEVRRLMGFARPRGRRGGRRRRGRGQDSGGNRRHGDAGPSGRKRRGRRGGRSRGGGGGGGSRGDGDEGPRGRRARPFGRRAPARPGLSKVARDSPLAQKRSSSGPKRGVQPRRRREPEF